MTSPSRTKPLAGWRVLVPRGGEWGNGVAAQLRKAGATPVVAPMINYASTDDAEQLVDALARLRAGAFDTLIVTSATTVDVFTSHEVEVPESTRVIAVGETTASALVLAGFRVDFSPEQDNSSRGLLKAWPALADAGHVLVPQSDVPDAHLVSGLAEFEVAAEFVTAYRTIGIPVGDEVVAEVASGRIGGILISSGSVARQVRDQFAPLPEHTVIAAIGPRTAFDAREVGIAIDVIAESRTADALVEAFIDFVRSHRQSA